MKNLQREGFRRVIVLRGQEQIDDAQIVREPAWTDRSTLHGPFDIIGDVHGCRDELVTLLDVLRYAPDEDGTYRHPDGRTAVFLGDLVDRGPDTPGVLRLVMRMVAAGTGLCVPGNHEQKLLRAMNGRNVQITHGLAESLEQLDAEPAEFRDEVKTFIDGLVSHAVLDDRKLVVAHAGLPAEMQGRASAAVRSFALYGETTGETDEFGLPVRYPWANDYRGAATVVYGHTPVPEPEWVNNTICVDTGCVFGGSLTALRYPERELVAVPAARVYYDPVKPFPAAAEAGEEAGRPPELLDIDDVLGKRGIETRLMGRLTVPEGNAAAALEVMSRFAADPRWVLYLPPTMAPPATTQRDGLLEHPDEAFDEYRREGVPSVICEEKHMGSRAVVVVCRTPDVARARLRIDGGGIVLTRTGRPFFGGTPWAEPFLARLNEALESSGLWTELDTDILLLDAEIMPWSLKAEQLLKTQYASVGAAAASSLHTSRDIARSAADRGIDVGDLVERIDLRRSDALAFIDAYRRYCWSVEGLSDITLAPFQVLAGSGTTFLERDHTWHMEVAERLATAAPELIQQTRSVVVDVTDPESLAAATAWWESLTTQGGEGMVVKPLTPIVRGRHGPIQPGIKVRGREYLRIIYGLDYTDPENLSRLRKRGLGRKRSLAAREFALGVEALERFARGEPLHRIHECVFAVLALESEPVDPRL
jgi:protein phosphatase